MEAENKNKQKKERKKERKKEGNKKGRENRVETSHVLGPVREAQCGLSLMSVN
jgi:hypothetical protein